jgi:hypothetical protein
MNQQLIDAPDSLATTISVHLCCGSPSLETVFEQGHATSTILFSLCLSLNLPQIEAQRAIFL